MPNQNKISRLVGEDWLKHHSAELTNLDNKIFYEICKFFVIWQLFEKLVIKKYRRFNEGKVIKERFAYKIERAVKNWIDTKGTLGDDFECNLRYFRNRYIEDGEFNHRFEYLKCTFESDYNRDFVANVLKSENDLETEKKVAGLLILIYQYRNQLFHAEKDLTDQKENFEHANAVLKKAIKKEKECHV